MTGRFEGGASATEETPVMPTPISEAVIVFPRCAGAAGVNTKLAPALTRYLRAPVEGIDRRTGTVTVRGAPDAVGVSIPNETVWTVVVPCSLAKTREAVPSLPSARQSTKTDPTGTSFTTVTNYLAGLRRIEAAASGTATLRRETHTHVLPLHDVASDRSACREVLRALVKCACTVACRP